MEKLKVNQIVTTAKIPSRAHSLDAGLDLYANETVEIPPISSEDNIKKIKTGIKIELPTDSVGIIHDRSSIGAKGLKVMGGVIDSEYRGEIIVCLANLNFRKSVIIESGDKVAQLVIYPILRPEIDIVDELSKTLRGNDGFGSTGIK